MFFFRNIQLCMPYQPCPFGCEMCIATAPTKFDNLYASNPECYFRMLGAFLESPGYVNVVLTGDTEPTLNKKWLKEVADFLKLHRQPLGFSNSSKPYRQVEIQTHNYAWHGMDGIDVNAFSITSVREARIIPTIRTDHGINRLVLLGTKDLMRHVLDTDIDVSAFAQVTIKALQYAPSVGAAEVNHHIDEIRCDEELLEAVRAKFAELGLSVVLDLDCQDLGNTYHRYHVFREDGRMYESWDDSPNK